MTSPSSEQRSSDSSYPPAFETAAEMLTAPAALVHLSLAEARVVVSYMTPRRIPANTTFIKEGDSGDDGFLALLLEGEVVVESITVSRTEPVTIRVLGAGTLVGEVGLIDGAPRSASCTTSTNSLCAILERSALMALIEDEPKIGCKLLLAISSLLAERLRDNARKLRLYAKLAQSMQLEIDRMLFKRPAG